MFVEHPEFWQMTWFAILNNPSVSISVKIGIRNETAGTP